MLVSSRDTGRWIIPKRWPTQGLTPRDSAAREAIEEGGLVGGIIDQSIGVYHYDKRVADGSMTRCTVEVFALEVEQQLTAWPEQHQRHTDWFTLEEAAEAVHEVELCTIIRNLSNYGIKVGRFHFAKIDLARHRLLEGPSISCHSMSWRALNFSVAPTTSGVP